MTRVSIFLGSAAEGGRLKDCAAVLLPNSVIIALMNFAPLNQLISIAAGLLAMAYTAWRWRRDARRERERKRDVR